MADLTSWIAGTAKRVSVANDGDGSVTLSGPQDLDTVDGPTFNHLHLSGLTAGRVVFSAAGPVLSDDADLLWDATNNYLQVGAAAGARIGIGIAPALPLDVLGAAGDIASRITSQSATQLNRSSIHLLHLTSLGKAIGLGGGLAYGVLASDLAAWYTWGSYATLTGIGATPTAKWSLVYDPNATYAAADEKFYVDSSGNLWTKGTAHPVGGMAYTDLTYSGLTASTFLKATGAAAASFQAIAPADIGAAPIDAQYVTLATNATLTNERVLTGTSNQITITDNGAGGTVVLSLPQNYHTAAVPQLARLGLGAAADATALLLGSGASPQWWLKDTGTGDTALSRTMQQILLTSAGMNTTNKYTPALVFGSTDPDLSTENPKALGMIVGRATEAYATDTAGGLAIDFATTPNLPGANSVPLVRWSIGQAGNLMEWQSSVIFPTTVDGADNMSLTLSAGGRTSTTNDTPVVAITRGPWLGLYGNEEATYPGQIRLVTPNTGGIKAVLSDAGTNATLSSMWLLHQTSGVIADGFGPGIVWGWESTSGTPVSSYAAGALYMIRDTGNTQGYWSWVVHPNTAAAEVMRVAHDGGLHPGVPLDLDHGGTAAVLADPGAFDTLMGWDQTDNTVGLWKLGTGLSYDHASHTLSSTSAVTLTNTGAFLGGDVNLATAGTWYPGPHVNLTAGTWLLTGEGVVIVAGAAGDAGLRMHIVAGDVTLVQARTSSPSVDICMSMAVSVIYVATGATQIDLDARGSRNNSTFVAEAYGGLGNVTSGIRAVKIG